MSKGTNEYFGDEDEIELELQERNKKPDEYNADEEL